MSAKVFLDTNVVAYAFDPSALAKQQRARELLVTDNWVVSWQVIQEFTNLALHRFAVPLKPTDLTDYLELVLWPHCASYPSPTLYRTATALHAQTQYRFYDCLILAGALASNATILYSEDLQAGRKIGSLIIENPF